jgi:hypothetical protein
MAISQQNLLYYYQYRLETFQKLIKLYPSAYDDAVRLNLIQKSWGLTLLHGVSKFGASIRSVLFNSSSSSQDLLEIDEHTLIEKGKGDLIKNIGSVALPVIILGTIFGMVLKKSDDALKSWMESENWVVLRGEIRFKGKNSGQLYIPAPIFSKLEFEFDEYINTKPKTLENKKIRSWSKGSARADHLWFRFTNLINNKSEKINQIFNIVEDSFTQYNTTQTRPPFKDFEIQIIGKIKPKNEGSGYTLDEQSMIAVKIEEYNNNQWII